MSAWFVFPVSSHCDAGALLRDNGGAARLPEWLAGSSQWSGARRCDWGQQSSSSF